MKTVGGSYDLRDKRGVVAVEFAILAVPTLMVIALALFAGVGFYSQTSLAFAVQQAAVASVAKQGADPDAIFAADVPTTLTGATLACTPSSASTTCNASGNLSVPFAGLFNIGDVLTLTASATAAAPHP